ncbi:MAG: helix-hairpin-helix domain-containing protein, partial [Gemmatimonadales bacterium]
VEVVGGGNADAIGFARDGDDAVGVVARIRGGRFVGKDQRFLENLSGESDGDVLAAFMVRHYLKSDVKATRVLLPFEVSDLDDLTQLLSPTRIRIPHRGKDRDLVDLADQNARHLMESFKIESFETTERAEDPVYALGRDLGLTAVPRSMACIDISTSQGMDTVGSLVWFEAGRPKKSEYRRYRIKGEQQNDFAAVAEVVDRFLRRRTDENKPLPDLLLIDGGKGQLSAARTAAAPYEVKTEFASIAKKEEEIYRASVPEPIRLSRSAPSLRLVQRMRDEAHRFAVEYNRNTRKKRTFASDLLNIPGVGPVRRRRLLERFGSLAGIKLATAAEIATIEGFSEVTAAKILDYLKE